MPPELYKLMTNQNLQRAKVYRDILNRRYFLCDAAKWSALTDPVWRVKKVEMTWDYVHSVTENSWYNAAIPNLASCQALTFD